MARIFGVLAMIVWGLWFGGVIALFVVVTALFRHNRSLAINTTPIIFGAFERYHLILAGVALIACGVWMTVAPMKIKFGVFAMLALGALAATASAGIATPRIMALRSENRVGTPDFRMMHGLSNALYTTEALALLEAGVLIASAQTRIAQTPAENSS